MTDATAATTSAASSNQLISAATTSSTASNLAAGQGNLNTSYTTFLTLLTTQLKNQDPTSPLDTNQFTEQLVQMTGVQQQLLSNELLQTLVNQGGGSSGLSSAAGLIGKSVQATGDTAVLSGGQASWSYSLPAAASSGTATVTNAAGQTVWTGSLSALGEGAHAFTWKGQTSAGQQLADGGSYKLSITASDSNGAAVTATTSLTGVVNSVETVNGATVLNLGATQVPYSSITQVQNASS